MTKNAGWFFTFNERIGIENVVIEWRPDSYRVENGELRIKIVE